MATKKGRQNRHRRRLRMKIARFERRGMNSEGLKKALAIAEGTVSNTGFKTGQAADSRLKKRS
tara:strand:+ start:277 stop:465 length:189 start_codon:yes stop_codon:yes gene_type:complete